MEGFRDESGLFGISGHRQAAHLAYVGLHSQQHRGGDGAGLVVSDGDLLRAWHGSGLVQEAFHGPHLQALRGSHAIGQVVHGGRRRAGEPDSPLPLLARYRDGQIAVAMAGHFTNADLLRQELKQRGAVFTTPSDAEVLLHLVATSPQTTLVNRLVDALWRTEGAFNVLVMTEDRLVAVRDPRGFRPLIRGRHEGAVVVATEDAPLRFLGSEIDGEVEPGQMLVADERGQSALYPFPQRERAACLQEFVQLAGPDAHVFGQGAYPVRSALGERLAREHPCPPAGVVVPLPGAGTAMAQGYSRQARIPFREGLVPAAYTGRRYVEPPQEIRDFGARLQWTPVPSVVAEQKVALVVPSIGRGDEVRKAVRLLRSAGAVEVHLRVGSPPIIGSCHYGVASPTTEELAVPRLGGDVRVADWLGVDSIGFLGLDSLRGLAGERADGTPRWCAGCFSGDYPVLPVEEVETDQLGLFDEGEE